MKYHVIVIALDDMHSSAVLRLIGFICVKLQLELVKVTRETSRHRHRRHPSRRGLAQIDRLRAGSVLTRGRIRTTNEHQISPSTNIRNREI